jgi:plastocyanin
MNVSSQIRRALLGAAPALAALTLMACGGDGDHARSGAAARAPAATQVVGGADAAAAPLARAETMEAITVVATDNAFAPAAFRVRAGQPFTVTLENQGQAAHDWRVRGLPAADGRDAGSRLLTAGQSQSFTLAIDRPGDFDLYCEVHPVGMRGTLSVVDGQPGATALTADR